jgi:hypothetical protein
MQKEIAREKAKAESEGRIREARENEDVNRRAALLRYQEEARKALEMINAVMSHLGAAAVDLLTDRNKLAMAVGGLSAVFLGLYGARETSRVVGGAVERWLGTPRLVRFVWVVEGGREGGREGLHWARKILGLSEVANEGGAFSSCVALTTTNSSPVVHAPGAGDVPN